MDLGAGLEAIWPWLSGAFNIGTLALIAKFYLDRQRILSDQRKGDNANALSVEMHRDELTMKLLETARVEIQNLRLEVDRLRPSADHLRHFEEALLHLEALLQAESGAELNLARRQARAYLNRMKRLNEARGTIANEVQRLDSGTAVAERIIRDEEGREPKP